MAAQPSAQLVPQSPRPQKRPRWRSIVIIIAWVASILALLFFISLTIFWVGLVHEKLSDTLSAIITGLGTIFAFIALVLAIPLFIQFLHERRAVTSPISPVTSADNKSDPSQSPAQQPTPNLGSIDSSKAHSLPTNSVMPSTTTQHSSALSPTSQSMNTSTAQTPATNPPPASTPRGVSKNPLRLTLQQKFDLVDKLLACPAMRDRSSRNRVVQQLSFSESISRNPDATNKEDVMDIVNRCLDFPGGLQQLIERIEFREENSIPMQQLRSYVQSLLQK